MSGIASAASTTPGSVATFSSCSSEESPAIASSSSWSAKTRAGTRMSERASAGISQSVSSIRRSSDIEGHASVPDTVALRELEPMVRSRLDERGRVAGSAAHGRAQVLAGELDLGALRYEAPGFGEEQQLLEPGDEQRSAVGGRELDLVCLLGTVGGPEELRECVQRVLEDRLFGACFDVELELRRVAVPLIHPRKRRPSSRRAARGR